MDHKTDIIQKIKVDKKVTLNFISENVTLHAVLLIYVHHRSVALECAEEQ